MTIQLEKGRAFAALHAKNEVFVMPNPWDLGSARVLERMGFSALATTSVGFAASIARVDGAAGRDAVLAHAAAFTSGTDLPISADLENGFGDAPETVAETIRLAAQAGLVGASIEDYSGHTAQPIYAFEHAVERVRAAAEAARSLPFPFTLTARAENLLRGRDDLKDTIRRLQAFQEAGADVLFAPGLRSASEIETLIREVDRPVSVLGGFRGLSLSVAELGALGVRRVSVGGLLAHVAYGALIHAATELRTSGSFGFASEVARAKELSALLADR